MGFADYLSRNPTGEAILPSDEDENFVLISKEEIKYFLLCNALTPNGATNHITDTKQVTNDLINPKRVYSKTVNAFCLNALTIQSDNILHSITSKFINSQTPSN